MIVHEDPPEKFVKVLAENLARIDAIAARLSPGQLTASTNGWSPNEVLWHIRATADVHDGQILRILDEDEPRWRHVSPRARMKKARYDQVPFAESLAAFRAQRTAVLQRLAGLPPEAWRRTAVVKVEQKEWRPTVHVITWGYAHHEAGHCTQLEELAQAVAPTP